MMNRQLARVRLRAVWFDLVERWADFWNIAFPVFFMVGLVAACARFWVWVLF